MLAALLTARGKLPNSKALWIGTRPSSPDHPFERELKDGDGYRQIHAARPDDNPFHVRTWKRANPSLDHMPDLLAQMRREAEKAKRDPSALGDVPGAALESWALARRLDALLLDADVWRSIETVEAVDRAGPYALGIDLGSTAAMSAASAYWPATGALDAFAVLPESTKPRGTRPSRWRRRQLMPRWQGEGNSYRLAGALVTLGRSYVKRGSAGASLRPSLPTAGAKAS